MRLHLQRRRRRARQARSVQLGRLVAKLADRVHAFNATRAKVDGFDHLLAGGWNLRGQDELFRLVHLAALLTKHPIAADLTMDPTVHKNDRAIGT